MTRFVSFATPDYMLEAASLVQSLEAHGLDYHVALVPLAGRDWAQVCASKPAFMLAHARSSQRPVCWVDADARVVRRPDFEALDHEDVAFARFGAEAMSGTVWVNDTGPGRVFLAEWSRLCEANPNEWDQRQLDAALERSGARFCELDPEFCWIFDLSRARYGARQPIIEHFQASRRLKRGG